MNTSKTLCLIGLMALTNTTFANTAVTKVQSADSDGDISTLETITTIGTRTERALNELDASVTVKTSDQLEQEMARDLEDLVRFEPGVTTGGTGSRFGLDGIAIRGIGGNRVLTTLDGIRLPEEFSFGPFLSARRDYIDIDSLQRADIARGPISPLYGSDALGGVVAFTSKKPLDYLQDKSKYASFKTGYNSADKSTVGTLTLAGGNDVLSGLLVYTHRDAEETENTGSLGGTGVSRELPDSQDISSDSLTFRANYQPNDLNLFTLSADYYTNETDTQVLSDYDTVSRGVLTTRRDADDERNRFGIAFGYEYDGQLVISDQLKAKLYYQESDSQQLTDEDRLSRGVLQNRTRLSEFEQEILGAQLNLNKAFSLGSSQHSISYGFDYYQTDNLSERNGSTNLATGAVIPEFFPFPTRDFPITKVKQTAFYLQDEILLADGKLRVTPGIRYDHFSANTFADEVYQTGNPGTPTPEDYEDSELTAKLGLLYEISPKASVYARYSEGFRAPPYDDVNVGFTNFIAGYKTISNPDLESETSKGYELGVRFQSHIGHLVIAAFQNDYDDFIESLATAPQFLSTGGVDPVDGLFTFQSLNLESVEIKGAEFSGALNLGAVNTRLKGVRFQGAIAYADGENQINSQPLNTVEPLSAVFGLSYENPSSRWGGNLYLTLVDGKNLNDINAENPRTPTGGYGLVDLMGHYKLTEKIRIDAGVFNLADKSYVRWADTAGIGDDAFDRFTQPGINSRVTLRIEI